MPNRFDAQKASYFYRICTPKPQSVKQRLSLQAFPTKYRPKTKKNRGPSLLKVIELAEYSTEYWL